MIVYIVKIESERKYKIGYTKRKLEKRLKELQTGCPDVIEPVWYFKSKYVTKLESYLHRQFKDKKIEGEWFLLENEDIDNIKRECVNFEKRVDFLMESENPFILKEFNH